ncbi:LOW QUALITY PROTEIN: uncharacterized protein ACR2FA_007884 [Aphomia sociella]
MVHAGPAARAPSRAMFAAAESKPRRAVSPLGIPKSPSFHSGLDLVANQAVTKRSESVSDVARAFRFALFAGAGMEGQGPPQKAPSPPDARSPPPAAAAAVSPERLSTIPNTDKESLMVQLPLLKGSSTVIRSYINIHSILVNEHATGSRVFKKSNSVYKQFPLFSSFNIGLQDIRSYLKRTNTNVYK